MSRTPAPAMPTEKQIRHADDIVRALHPGARIVRVGADGVTFAYPDDDIPSDKWKGLAFSGDGP